MASFFITKKEFIEFIQEMPEEHKFLVTTELDGEIKGATKKKPFKVVPFAFPEKFFKNAGIADLIGFGSNSKSARLFSVFANVDVVFSDEVIKRKKEFDEQNAKESKTK